jgi:hypothetical protein
MNRTDDDWAPSELDPVEFCPCDECAEQRVRRVTRECPPDELLAQDAPSS